MIEPRTGRSDDLQRIHANFPIELTRIDTNYGGFVKIAVILNCFPTNRRNGNRARHMINTCTFGLSVWLSICLAISLAIDLSGYLSGYQSGYRSVWLSVWLSICLAINLAIVSIWLSIWQGFLSAHRD
jgi:hypothetical protein